MRLTFHGAAGEVTGSSLVVEAGDVRFLVDYGMFQGGREAPRKNREAYARELGRLEDRSRTLAEEIALLRLEVETLRRRDDAPGETAG